MQTTKLNMKPLTNHDAIPRNHRANKRIGTDAPEPALGKLKSSPQVLPIRGCQLGIHRTD